MTETQEKVIKKLVDIGLNYAVDRIYVLEDIERVLNGKNYKLSDIKPENYYD